MDKPRTVRSSALLWAIAVAAGVTETGLVVTETAAAGALDLGIWANIGARSVVYTGAALLAVALYAGRRWARTALAVLLGGVGLASMVVPAALEMAGGSSFADAMGTEGPLSAAFVSVRALHIAAVVAATALMFTPGANAYFSYRPRR